MGLWSYLLIGEWRDSWWDDTFNIGNTMWKELFEDLGHIIASRMVWNVDQ